MLGVVLVVGDAVLDDEDAVLDGEDADDENAEAGDVAFHASSKVVKYVMFHWSLYS